MERREALQLIAGAIGIPTLLKISPERLGQRLVLNEHQDRTVTIIAELILPETDTPGATAAQVNGFVDVVLSEWLDEAEKEGFLTGLADVDARSTDRYGTVFIDATEAQQVELLTELDAEVEALREADDPDPERHFFGRMRWLTIFGYYTSEVGQTQELRSEIIPGRYDPCAPLQRDTPGEW